MATPNLNARLFNRARTSRRVPTPSPSGTSSTAESCKPACASCGMLECLCRPRFFAGQLLSEQDLNRLDAYIRAKNRLHTLQLHGWGVVNGLAVRCDPCGSGVVVGTGYGISPCGEDIIVCGDTTVDICSLIKQCRTSDVTCQPTSSGSNGCGDLVEDWVLAIRYAETPTRGVTALRTGASCGCNSTGGTCASGNGSGCGCGGAVAKTSSTTPSNAMTTTTTQKPRGASAECEPTVICESYSFDVYLAPTQADREDTVQLPGSMIDAFLCCLQPLVDAIGRPPADPTPENFSAISTTSEKRAWNLWCCRVKAALITHFSNGPQSSCTLAEQLGTLVCPGTNVEDFGDAMAQAYEQLKPYLIQAFVSCICSALLPPAPFGTSDDRVPLAVVSVRKRDCKVMSVCNWTPLRKLVITGPTLDYWIGWLPVFGALREIAGQFCCGDVDRSADDAVNPELSPQAVQDNETLAELIEAAVERLDAPIDAAAVIDGVFGLNAGTDQPFDRFERANPAPWAVLNELLGSVARSFRSRDEGTPTDDGPSPTDGGPFDIGDDMSTERRVIATEGVTGTAEDMASLRERIAVLEAAVRELRDR
jgi:hypothetical protein